MNKHEEFVLLVRRTRPIYALLFLVSVLIIIPACAGIKHREFDRRLILLQQRYSGSIVRTIIRKENGGFSEGTAFYFGQDAGFMTARHVLMLEGEKGRENLAERLALHIPSATTAFSAETGVPSSDEHDLLGRYDADWAVFRPTNDALVRRPLVYDSERYLKPGQDVYIAGYPNMDREYEYAGTFPIEYAATRNLFIHKTEYVRLVLLIESIKEKLVLDTARIPNGMSGLEGISGGPVLVWDDVVSDFIAVGILIIDYSGVHQDTPLLLFIRPKFPPIMLNPETN